MITDSEALHVIAANCRRLRGTKSQSQVARECSTEDWKCYPATIQQIEAGHHMPGAGLLARLAEALGVTPNELLGLSREATSKKAS